MNSLQKQIGVTLRKIRLQRKYNTEALAYLCESNKDMVNVIQRMEHGRGLNVANLSIVCGALDIKLSDLIATAEQEHSELPNQKVKTCWKK